MKPVFSTLLAASLALLTPPIAEACQGVSQLTRGHIAFADVIFEGSLKDISPKSSYLELTFDVHDVKRGELPQGEVVVGWRTNRSYSSRVDLNLESFTGMFGETTRVAMSTPQLADRFCKPEMGYMMIRDEETGEYVRGLAPRRLCHSTPNSIKSVHEENIPFVLSNGPCGTSYLYSVQKYEKMRDYDKNLAAFEQAVADGSQVSSSQFFHEIVGGFGPLPWKGFYTAADDITRTLFREHTDFFTPSLRTNAAWQASLMDLGEVMAREQSASLSAKFDSDEASLLKFRESLNRQIIKLLDNIEKDPEFGNRLLEDD